MPRGSSRQFRTKYSGAANLLGIDGTANRLTDKGFVAESRGAFESQGFGVSGRNVSRIFQANADLAQAELGLSPFSAQTQSIDFNGGTDALSNQTTQAIGIADVWTALCWHKPDGVSGTHIIWDLDTPQPSIDGARLNLHQQNANLNLIVEDQLAAGGLSQVGWTNVLNAGVWHFLVFSWNGSSGGQKMQLYIDGVNQGAPQSGDPSPAFTMADTSRMVSVGNNAILGGSGALGRILYLALHRVELSQPAIETLFNLQNGGVGGAIDLNTNSGSYSSAGDLAHWWRCGNRASPNLGEDSAAAGFTGLIDIETNAIGITDGDRVADVPS